MCCPRLTNNWHIKTTLPIRTAKTASQFPWSTTPLCVIFPWSCQLTTKNAKLTDQSEKNKQENLPSFFQPHFSLTLCSHELTRGRVSRPPCLNMRKDRSKAPPASYGYTWSQKSFFAKRGVLLRLPLGQTGPSFSDNLLDLEDMLFLCPTTNFRSDSVDKGKKRWKKEDSGDVCRCMFSLIQTQTRFFKLPSQEHLALSPLASLEE